LSKGRMTYDAKLQVVRGRTTYDAKLQVVRGRTTYDANPSRARACPELVEGTHDLQRSEPAPSGVLSGPLRIVPNVLAEPFEMIGTADDMIE